MIVKGPAWLFAGWLCVSGLLAVPSILCAQASPSLAELARREEQRRQAITQPGKVYTNADLGPDTFSRPSTPPGLPLTAAAVQEEVIDGDGDAQHPRNFCESCPRESQNRIRRDPAARRAFLLTQGITDGRAPDGFVVDHVMALCAGGADHPSNMQLQTIEAARQKDRTECDGPRIEATGDRAVQTQPVAPVVTSGGTLQVVQPVIVMPLIPSGPTCGANTPRENALAGATSAAGFGSGGSGQPCPPASFQPTTPGGK
jgi:hypothetical protein